MSDTRNPLQANMRPGAMDVRGQQPSLFPFDAFVFDDPNRVENPALKMKEPWKFVTNGIEIYGEGVDPDNIVEGDRRLIAEGEVLKLQHYDGTEWIDDISLGGYDENGEFIEYIQASGIARDVDDVTLIAKGLGFPSLIDQDQEVNFTNSLTERRVSETKPLTVGTVVMGNYGGLDYINASNIGYRYDNFADAAVFTDWWGTL